MIERSLGVTIKPRRVYLARDRKQPSSWTMLGKTIPFGARYMAQPQRLKTLLLVSIGSGPDPDKPRVEVLDEIRTQTRITGVRVAAGVLVASTVRDAVVVERLGLLRVGRGSQDLYVARVRIQVKTRHGVTY